jgi:hypothetical protein
MVAKVCLPSPRDPHGFMRRLWDINFPMLCPIASATRCVSGHSKLLLLSWFNLDVYTGRGFSSESVRHA